MIVSPGTDRMTRGAWNGPSEIEIGAQNKQNRLLWVAVDLRMDFDGLRDRYTFASPLFCFIAETNHSSNSWNRSDDSQSLESDSPRSKLKLKMTHSNRQQPILVILSFNLDLGESDSRLRASSDRFQELLL